MAPAYFCLIMIHLLTSKQICDPDASTAKREKTGRRLNRLLLITIGLLTNLIKNVSKPTVS